MAVPSVVLYWTEIGVRLLLLVMVNTRFCVPELPSVSVTSLIVIVGGGKSLFVIVATPWESPTIHSVQFT